MFKKNLKKAVTIALTGCMMVGAVAGCGTEDVENSSASNNSVASSSTSSPASSSSQSSDNQGTTEVDATYTFNDYMSGMGAGLNWNPHSWETSDDSIIIDYITMGLYTFDVNADKTGYEIVPEMAAEMPVDVTADYVGKYGIVEGETAKAWSIALNKDAAWSDGTPINADSYIYSMQQQLNPYMLNRRADSYYAGEMEIVNAKNYLYSNMGTTYSLLTSLVDYTGESYLDMSFWGLVGALDAEGNACPSYVAITDETLYRDTAIADAADPEAWVSAKYVYDTYLAAGKAYESYAPSYLYGAVEVPAVSWEDVGLFKTDDYTIVLVLTQPMAEAEFYLPYNLSSNWLVHETMYESCKTYWDKDGKEVTADDPNVDSITTDYCTTIDTSIGYGPYELTYFELDKQITLSKNDSWYGYTDGKHEGMYQTDVISIQVIDKQATALMEFLNGNIDAVSLTAEDMATYASSDYILYTPQSYTTKLTFNTNLESLKSHGRGSEVLMVKEFREAFSFAIDRAEFTSAYTSAAAPGYGLINYMYCYDPYTGALYRDSDPAKDVIVDLNNMTYGKDGDFEDLDEAYDAVTGYNLEYAQSLMKTAYDKAIAEGLYTEGKDITIEFRVYDDDETYVKMFNYLDSALKSACVGSGFEGHVSLIMTADADYYETMYSGGADMIFTTWGGATMNPFSTLANCYTDGADGSGNQMEYGFDTSKYNVDITVDGKAVTASIQDWSNWMRGDVIQSLDAALGKFADYDYSVRCEIFAAVEYAFLDEFVTFSMYYRQSASLLSAKATYYSEQYLTLVGFGGIRRMTYNYSDAEWETVKATIKY